MADRRKFLKTILTGCVAALLPKNWIPNNSGDMAIVEIENPIRHHCDGQTSPQIGKEWVEFSYPMVRKDSYGTVWIKRIFITGEKTNGGLLKTKSVETVVR